MDPMIKARELAESLRGSQEVKAWEQSWRELAVETQLTDDLLRYQEMRLQVETYRWQGEEPPSQLLIRWQALKEKLEQEPSFRRFVEAEEGVARLTTQIQQVLTEAVSPTIPSTRPRT
ncbi:YlbF family regulator [Desmospora profundinema]|uniref:Cell fate (Sporulation/competence/biofilm development) regulator YlbF (YheA/YmcA/DUF963 family) n=1 Tax=Desmospora profundinema TaxID=1571184 RepID=A0ABU1IPD1_9BACL|nr:YlbF family regulator [Desmospora profundinema]MDR6226652.1 cell fate (sporulation/competence/biofilm development) regulator YlbF (YheA/YmcA/DUF963 family) [Desmospora profundinema]